MTAQSEEFMKYVRQLEKRVQEQEQLITLLNEKLAALSSGPNARDAEKEGAKPMKPESRDSSSFVGSRKSTQVPSVVPTRYNQYFVSRVNPEVTAETLAQDLLSTVTGLTSVKCSKMKTRYSSYASFNVVIPVDLGHLVESGSAWPEGALVKTFTGRLLPAYVLEFYNSEAPSQSLSDAAAGKASKKSKPP